MTPIVSFRALNKIFIFFVVIIFIAYLGVRLWLSYSGYCYEQNRYIPDKEKIEIAIKSIMSISVYAPFNSNDEVKQIVPYNNISDFLIINPDCCEVTEYEKGDFGQHGKKISFLDKLTGTTESHVRIRYKFQYINKNGEKGIIIKESYIAISNCGRTH